MDHHQILKKAMDIQNDDINRLGRVTKQVNETKELGAATLVQMSEQREQIIAIDKGVDEVESNLRIANRHLRYSSL